MADSPFDPRTVDYSTQTLLSDEIAKTITASEDFHYAQMMLTFLADQGIDDAILHGGFLRDMAFMNPTYKDIDIAVHYRHKETLERIFGEPTHALSTEYDRGSGVYCADWEVRQWGIVFNVILYQPGTDRMGAVKDTMIWTPQSIAEMNDWGICQIAWTAADGLFISEHFVRDMLDKRHTLCDAMNEERSMRRLAKLKQKYNWPQREDNSPF